MNGLQLKKSKGFILVHLNVRSLYKKLPEISEIYQHVDCLFFTETWFDSRYTNGMINIPNFVPYRLDRCEADPLLINNGMIPRRGGGVIIYVKNKWAPFVNIYKNGTTITENFEMISITLDKPGVRKMYLTCVYKPPKGKLTELVKILNEVVSENAIILREKWIMGDFNVDFSKRNMNSLTVVKDFMKNNGFKQIISDYTRISNMGRSCIDWILTDCDYVDQSGVLNDLLSDHYPIFCVRKKKREVVKKEWKYVRQYKNYNKNVFENSLTRADWHDFDTTVDIDEKWDIFLSKLNDILSVMCPYKNVYVRSRKTPWMSPDIIFYMKERAKLCKIFKKTGSAQIFELCRHLRNKVTRMVRNAKSNYIKDNLTVNHNNPRKFWRILKSVFDENRTNIDIEFIDPVTKCKVEKSETCDFLNKYFVEIGQTSNTRIIPAPVACENEYAFENVLLPEIINLIKCIDTTKDSCIHGITSCIFKCALSVLPSKLQQIFSLSLSNGKFPRKWAKGNINILPKSGDLSHPGNWRPKTQTCIPAKMLEKIVHKRLMSILTEKHTLSENQYGFRNGRSTQSATFDLVTDLYHNMNSNLATGVLFLDVRKAFDSLNHDILLMKLRNLGLNSIMINWFSSYLNRFQTLRFNGKKSNELKVLSGIPQGSILGPTLFIFYINDLFDAIKNVKVKMFADDCVLYAQGPTWQSIYTPLQNALDTYLDWGKKNCLSLNASKTKAMIMGNRGKLNSITDPAPFNAGNSKITFVESFVYLGFTLDRELMLYPLYKNVCRQVDQKLFILRKIRRYITCDAAKTMYKQMILPLLDYSGFLLFSCTKEHKRELQKKQNSAIRTCLSYNRVDHITIDRLHHEMGLISLEQRRSIQLLKLLFVRSKNIEYLKIPCRALRGNCKVKFKLMTRCSGKYMNSPLYRGSVLRDQLEEGIQKLPTVPIFNKALCNRNKEYTDLLY